MTLSKVIPLSLCGLCVFCSLTPYVSVLFVFQRKELVLLNLISRYMTSTSEYFLKSKDNWDLYKVNVFNSKLKIQVCFVYT